MEVRLDEEQEKKGEEVMSGDDSEGIESDVECYLYRMTTPAEKQSDITLKK